MSEEELRKQWRQSRDSRSRDTLTGTEAETITRSKRKTALTRLADRYARFSNLAFIFALVSPAWIANPEVGGKHKSIIIICMMIYFIMCGAIDRHICHKVKAINIFEMPTSEVIARAMKCRLLHLRSMAFIIPLAITLLILFSWSHSWNPYINLGIISGALFGVSLGTIQFRRFMRDYRDMKE